MHLGDVDADHGLAEPLADLGQDLGVLEVRDGLDDSLGALLGVAGLEDAGADEDAVTAQLHHEGGVGRGGDTTGGEVDDGEPALLGGLAKELVGAAELAGEGAELGLRVGGGLQDGAGTGNLGVDGAHVLDGLDDVAGAGLTLGADHGSALRDAAQGLAQVAAAADEGGLEVVLGDVVEVIGGGEDFGLVDVVDANGFEDLGVLAGVIGTGNRKGYVPGTRQSDRYAPWP